MGCAGGHLQRGVVEDRAGVLAAGSDGRRHPPRPEVDVAERVAHGPGHLPTVARILVAQLPFRVRSPALPEGGTFGFAEASRVIFGFPDKVHSPVRTVAKTGGGGFARRLV